MMQNKIEDRFSLVQEERDVGLVLSADAKPRLKWTPELHQCFVESVSQLGGPEKATPKTVMRLMAIPGLTLFHLKSHLQKYRLGKNQQSGTSSDSKKDCTAATSRNTEARGFPINGENLKTEQTQINESMQITRALQMQLEVQQKLHEQIEVQKHLQLRIEAQGRYLQSVLKKAQETLAGYSSSSLGVEATKAELSELVSLVNFKCPSPSFSGLTEMSDSCMKKQGTRLVRNCSVPHQPQLTDCSMDSCLTSSESSDRKDEKQQSLHIGSADLNRTFMLQSVEMNQNDSNLRETNMSKPQVGEKRSRSPVYDNTAVEQKLPNEEKSDDQQFKRLKLKDDLDLNSQYQSEIDLCGQKLDLNCWI